MAICPKCGAEVREGLLSCMICGTGLNQQAPASTSTQPSSPFYQNLRPPRTEFEKITPWLIIIGTILIGIGIAFLGMVPGDVYIDTDSFQTFSDNEFHPKIQITSLQIAALLIGIGTIFEGLAAGLNVKANFDIKKQK